VAVSSAVVAVVAGVFVLNSEPNARYVYAAMPLALIPVAALLAWAAAHQRALYRAMLAFLLAATALNAYFLPSSSYYDKDFCLRVPFSRAERDLYLNEASPARKVLAWRDRVHPDSAVMFTHDIAIAGAKGTVYENHWHQWPIWYRMQQAATVPELLGVMNGWGVRYLITRKPYPGEEADPPVLAQLIAACTQPEYEAGDYYLARLDPACRPRDPADPPLALEPGFYDDYDPAIVFRGDWRRQPHLQGADRDTATSTDAPGAEIQIAFRGRELHYIHGMGPNYGIAQVTVDGQAQRPLDLFHKESEWQQNDVFCCFGPGRHEAVVRATGEKNAESTGTRIDLDSIQIK
jgi:hypothetical protein